MKVYVIFALIMAAAISWQACNNEKDRYVDVNTGKPLNLEKDHKSGLMVDAETGKQVDIYVDTKTKDTINGRTGKVINGRIRKSNSGSFVYIDDQEYSGESKIKRTEDEIKIKDGEYKKEVEKDGDITIKDGNTKIKIDGETGKKKVKKDD